MSFSVNGANIVTGANAYFANVTTTVLSTLNNQYQGTVAGFAVGGGPVANSIDKFPFAQDTYVSDHGDLAVAKGSAASATSTTHGYSLSDTQNVKFPFANQSGSTSVTDFYPGLQPFAGINRPAGSSSQTHGYSAGGLFATEQYNPAPWGFNYDYGSRLYKFAFAQNEKSSLIGSISPIGYGGAGQTSISNGFGYVSGRFQPAQVANISRYPFASDSPAVSIASLTRGTYRTTGVSSQTHGYTLGGQPGPQNIIDKFPFATVANATDVGDLTIGRLDGGGVNSTTDGYLVGSRVDKFPFATDTNSTNIGNLLTSRDDLSGNQD